jgi:hypothetical protein
MIRRVVNPGAAGASPASGRLTPIEMDPTWRAFRRIEQEKMPFVAALTAIDELLYSPAAVQHACLHSSELGFCSED